MTSEHLFNLTNVLAEPYFPEKQSPLQTMVNLGALRDNFLFLKKYLQPELMPVIKADAYGHGLVPCAQTLLAAGASRFAVGTVQEGAMLREASFTCPIVALLGALSPAETQLAAQQGITPLIASFEQLLAWQTAAGKNNLPFALKFDTGMGRLGFGFTQLSELLNLLDQTPWLKPALLVSHLSVADEDNGVSFTEQQIKCFEEISAVLRKRFPDLKTSLFNSAGLLAHAGKIATDIGRPGIALYGANPLQGTTLNKPAIDAALKQAMQVRAPIVQVHALRQGQSVSYGRTFVAPQDMRIAIVAAGYAEGYSRGLSNKGEMCLNGRRAPVLGRVCMQLTAIDVSQVPDAKEGDFAFLLGGEGEAGISAAELARLWGSITYEVFCLLGVINRRTYLFDI